MKRVNFLFWIGLAISLGLMVAAGFFTALHLTYPSDGAYLKPGGDVWKEDGVVVTPLSDDFRGLKEGDIVVAVAGRSLASWINGLGDLEAIHPNWGYGDQVPYTVIRDGSRADIQVTLGKFPLAAILEHQWGTFLFSIVNLLVAIFVFSQRPEEPAAQLYLLMSMCFGSAMTWSLGLQVSDFLDGIGYWLFILTTGSGYILAGISLLHFWLVFPERHPVLSRSPLILPGIYVFPYLFVLLLSGWSRVQSTSLVSWAGEVSAGAGFIELIYFSLIVLAAISGYRATQNPLSRIKVRWILLAIIIVTAFPLLFGTIPTLITGEPLVDWNGFAIVGLLLPLSIAIAILRNHLFDINLIINRTLVYSSLTAGIVGTYVLVVGALGTLFQTSGNIYLSLVATGIAALIFQPFRERLQRSVNRMMYGERDEPYAVLSQLGQQLETSLSPENTLPTVVETISQSLKLPFVAIELEEGDKTNQIASYGLPPYRKHEEPYKLPLIYQNAVIGWLVLLPRSSGKGFTRAELRLLRDIARQVGVAAHAARLTENLQRSRQRIITTREEERRRLRRDLHDGLGPQLASMTLKIDAARNLLDQDPVAAQEILSELKDDSKSALGDIRRIAYNLRPPALDELGLVASLREHITAINQPNGLRISIQAPADNLELPAAVEVAAYRISMEALTNVMRHAEAKNCLLRIQVDKNLALEIRDDGKGLPQDGQPGLGLKSMQERAVELGGHCTINAIPGGGTRVVVELPLNHENF
jgi:two-component system NarL family sensor kinase